MANPYSQLISIESHDDAIASPPAILKKDPFTIPDLPTAYELSELATNGQATANNAASGPSRSGALTPVTPNELELSRPASPDYYIEGVVQTINNPPINKWRVLVATMMLFGNGLNDAAPGALIPYMEKEYHIGYAVVSLMFVTNAIGFISAAPLVQILQARFGRAKVLAMSMSIMATAYIMLVCNPPFPVVVLAFLLLGFGIAFNLALNTTFCAGLAGNTAILGIFHGGYGVGGTVGPLIATTLVTHGHAWSTFYFLALALALCNLCGSYYVFRHYERDNSDSNNALRPTNSNPTGTHSKSALLKEALRNRTTVLGALFIFAYQGAEVSISGWVISFLISYRHSSPTRVGYVSAGFWGGITLGRFLLSQPCHKFGERRSVFLLTIGATAFQLLVWLVPNVIGEAVAVALVGLLLGPIYPCITTTFTTLLPPRLLIGSLAAMSALGSSGGAVAPFFTGLLAQEVGTWVLHPICIALFAAMVACWALLPRVVKRRE